MNASNNVVKSTGTDEKTLKIKNKLVEFDIPVDDMDQNRINEYITITVTIDEAVEYILLNFNSFKRTEIFDRSVSNESKSSSIIESNVDISASSDAEPKWLNSCSNPYIARQIWNMGMFDDNKILEALKRCSSVDSAVNWILENSFE